LRPAEGLLTPEEIKTLVRAAQANGALVTMKLNADGSKSPYEINVSLFDALRTTLRGRDDLHVDRFLCGQLIMLGIQGIPAVYIHSLTATPNDHLGVDASGRTRSINRHNWLRDELISLLDDPATEQARVFAALRSLMTLRRKQPAFHPDASQEIIAVADPAVFAFRRRAVGGTQRLMAVHNVAGHDVSIDRSALGLGVGPVEDLLDHDAVPSGEKLDLAPYQVRWIDVT